MSGPICQDCGCPSLKRIEDSSLGEWPVECEFCGWQGDASNLPRKMLMPESYAEWSQKMELFRKGELVLLVIRGDQKANPDLVFDVMRVLKLKSLSHSSAGAIAVIRVERSSDPSEADLEVLRKIKGMVSVEVRKG